MGLRDWRLIVRPGRGLVARRPGAVFLIVDADDPAAADLLAAVRSVEGAGLVEELFDVVRKRRPAPVAAFCVLVEESGELYVAIHGKLVVEAASGGASRRFAGSTPTSRVEETLSGDVSSVTVGQRTPRLAGEGFLDLVEGVASAGAFELAGREAVAASPVARVKAAVLEPAAVAPLSEPQAEPAPEPQPQPQAEPELLVSEVAPPAPVAAPADPGATTSGVPRPTVEAARAELKQALTMAYQTMGAAPEHAAAPEIEGRLCSSGHLNDPTSSECWICGSAVGSEPSRGQRPPLGRITTKDKRSFILDGNFVLGRQPETSAEVKEGRARPIEVPHDQAGVSRAHAALELDGWTIRLRDLRSSNGTFYLPPGAGEWQRVDPAQPVSVPAGTLVTLGGYEFQVERL